MINVACPCLQPAQYRPATAYCIKLGKSGTRRSPGNLPPWHARALSADRHRDRRQRGGHHPGAVHADRRKQPMPRGSSTHACGPATRASGYDDCSAAGRRRAGLPYGRKRIVMIMLGSVTPSNPRSEYLAAGAASGVREVDRDTEHPGPVLRFTDHGLVVGMPLGKGREAGVRVDVVHQHDPARSTWPRPPAPSRTSCSRRCAGCRG